MKWHFQLIELFVEASNLKLKTVIMKCSMWLNTDVSSDLKHETLAKLMVIQNIFHITNSQQ